MTFLIPRSAWLCAGLLAATGAQAQDYDDIRMGGAPREGGTAGLALIAGKAYAGSDESRVSLLPAVQYRWANGWFAGIGSGVGYEFLSQPGTTAGVRVTPDFGRKERRSTALVGTGDIGFKPELGVYLNHAVLTPGLVLHGGLRAGGNGVLGELGIGYGMPLAPALRLRLGASTTLANGKHMQTYFGIDDTQSANSNGVYAPYEAKAGVRDTKLSATLLYLFTPGWALSATLAATTLHSDAANSPLTRERTSVTGLLSVGTRF